MAHVRAARKKTALTKKKATRAAKHAHARLGRLGSGGTPKAWKKGGREWSRVLGHFGLAE